MIEIKFIPQCKGLDANKVKVSDSEIFYCSIKYDGVYIQIHKVGDVVKFFTSSGKEFYCSYGEEFKKLSFDFAIEAEYICDGGKLGTRFKADNEIKKVVKDSSFELTGTFMIFDTLQHEVNYEDRILFAPSVFNAYDCVFKHTMTYKDAKAKLESVSSDGWEGLFLIKPSHIQTPGKKSKDAVKLKNKYTADLVVTKIDGMKLWLVNPEDGKTAYVTIGSDVGEMLSVGDICEIEYEQIVNTYLICVFKRIRFDKMS